MSLQDAYFVVQTGTPTVPRSRPINERSVLAKFDSAGDGADLARWWSQSDSLGPNTSASHGVRKKIRQRARYELSNNSFGRGLVLLSQNSIVGVGPRVQVQTSDKELNTRIESEFHTWMRATNLATKLRTMVAAKKVDGETFGELINNRRLKTPSKLDIRVVEADYYHDPHALDSLNPLMHDGILHDESGVPISYRRLNQHPGESVVAGDPWNTTDVPADQIIHWLRPDRPDQRRGVSEFSPSLTLFAQLRRFTQSVLDSADTAAKFAAIMYSDASAYSEDPEESDESFLNIPLPSSAAMLSLPAGWKAMQMKAEQPTTTYEAFVTAIQRQIARVVLIPENLASGSSKQHNFASSKLDYLTFRTAIDIERHDMSCCVLDPIFDAWFSEVRLIPDYLPVLPESVAHEWSFPRHEPVDGLKEAQEANILLAAGLLTDEQYLNRNSVDPDLHYASMHRMNEEREKAGRPVTPSDMDLDTDDEEESQAELETSNAN